MRSAEPETQTATFPGHEATPGAAGPIFQPDELVAGRFRVLRLLGQGGMAQVFAAADLELGQQVAIKAIRPELAAGRRAQQLLRSEVLLARRVTHPNVCRIFDVFQHPAPQGPPAASQGDSGPGTLVVAMELVRGETLARRLATGGPLTPAEALPIIRQLAAALDAAHRAQVVHGDFKSGNVILEPTTSGPRAVVTDFGLAQRAPAAIRATGATAAAGPIGGTAPYMAPELRRAGEVTPASNIYALGVVIHEMVKGHRPLPGRAGALAVVPPSPPRELPPDWRPVVARCLAPVAAERPVSAGEVARALAAARAAAPAGRSARAWRRLRTAVRAAALCGICLGVVAPGPTDARRSPAGLAAAVADGGAAEVDGPARPRVAVAALTDTSPRPVAAWMGPALAHAVATGLGAGDAVDAVLVPEAGPWRSRDAELAISGTFDLTPDDADPTLRLAVAVRRVPSGAVVASLREAGRLSTVAAVAARLSGRLRAAIGIAEPSAGDRQAAAALRPATLAAEGLYALGLAALARGELLGAYEMLGKAVTADPTFPLSHAALARVCAALGDDREARHEGLLAAAGSERLPERQRLEVDAVSRRAAGDLAGAAGLLGALTPFAPRQRDDLLQLAETQLAAGEARGALATLRALRGRGAAAYVELLAARAHLVLSDLPAAAAAARAAAEGARRGGNAYVLGAAELVAADTRAEDGDVAGAAQALASAREGFERAGFRGGEGEVVYRLAQLAARAGDLPRALALNEQAVALLMDAGATRDAARARAATGRFLLMEHRGEARTLLTHSLAELRASGDRAELVHVLDNLSQAARDGGDNAAAERLMAEAVSLEAAIGDRKGLARALVNLATYEGERRGELQAARRHLTEALRISQELGLRTGEAFCHVNLGALLLSEGKLHAAVPDLLAAIRLAREAHWPYVQSSALLDLFEVELQEARLGTAETTLRQALAGGKPDQDEGALVCLARLRLWQGRFGEADLAARQASGADRDPTALAILAMAQAGQGKLEQARATLGRAEGSLAARDSDQHVLMVAIAAARVALAAGDPAGAAPRLEEVLRRFAFSVHPELVFEARLLLGQAHLAAGGGTTSCRELRFLGEEARRERYELIARAVDGVFAGRGATSCAPLPGHA